MTAREAAELLRALAAAFGRRVDQAVQDVWWNSALQHCPYPDGCRTVAAIIATDERFPTPARFNAVRRALAPRHPVQVLDPPPVPATERERVRDLVAATRTRLRTPGGTGEDQAG